MAMTVAKTVAVAYTRYYIQQPNALSTLKTKGRSPHAHLNKQQMERITLNGKRAYSYLLS